MIDSVPSGTYGAPRLMGLSGKSTVSILSPVISASGTVPHSIVAPRISHYMFSCCRPPSPGTGLPSSAQDPPRPSLPPSPLLLPPVVVPLSSCDSSHGFVGVIFPSIQFSCLTANACGLSQAVLLYSSRHSNEEVAVSAMIGWDEQ